MQLDAFIANPWREVGDGEDRGLRHAVGTESYD